MPKLKPCPACGSRECESVVCTISADEHQSLHYNVECGSCYASGPVLDIEADAIAAWNSLPRALTWTTEPPKVAGWYWCMDIDKSEGYPIISYYDDWAISTVLPKINQGKVRFEWAGPIPTPLEPGES